MRTPRANLRDRQRPAYIVCMRETQNPRSLGDDDLLRSLTESVRQSRRIEAVLVAQIAEVDARKLYAREGFPSMFAYCTDALHLSEPETGLRLHVARACQEHPMLLEMLQDGRLHVSGIATLAPHLTRENREAILKRAVHKSKRQIGEIVAELKPRPESPAVIRRLPRPGADSMLGGSRQRKSDQAAMGIEGLESRPRDTAPSGPTADAPRGHEPRPLLAPPRDTPDATDGPIRTGEDGTDGAAPTGEDASEHRPDDALGAPDSAPRSRVEPVAPGRVRVHFTASTSLREKLERLRDLMRSSVPDGDLGEIVEQAVTEKLERLEARRFGKTKKPRKSLAETNTKPTSRRIPAAVRRAVHERDEGRCTYVDRLGRRCRAREKLEFHHHDTPFGQGGDHSVDNVRLTCRTHNLLLAERCYGKEKMKRFRRDTLQGRVSEGAAVYGAGAARRPADPLQGSTSAPAISPQSGP